MVARGLPRRPRRLAAGLVVALAGTLATLGATSMEAASATVAVHEVYTIPTSGPAAGRFSIIGRGYGHGHGLSQYGAKGAAEAGLNATKILAFYYPGTTQAKMSTGIRVQLSAAPRDNLLVTPTATLNVRDLGNHGIATTLPTAISGIAVKQWRLGVTSTGRTQLDYLQTTWKAYRTLIGEGEFFDSHLGYVTLLSPGPARYWGDLLAASSYAGDKHRYTVNVLGLEQYVRGVVASEMSPSWPAAALQAQAVAARTYALFEKAENAGNYYDICDTTWCQVYGGIGAEQPTSNAAVSATTSVYLTYQGRPAFTQFAASNAGWMSYGGEPYLASKADPYTPTPEQVYGRSFSWSLVRTSVAPLEQAYPSIGRLKSVTITGREGGGTWNGRVASVLLTGTTGTATLSGGDFAAIYGLNSTWFTINVVASTPAT